MVTACRKALAVAHFSALEALGTPLSLLLALAAAVSTLTLPLLQFQRFSEDGRLARDCGFATALLLGLFLAVAHVGRVRQAVRDGTAAMAFVKPLSRGLWLVGHFAGTLVALGHFLVVQALAVLTAEAASPRYHAGATGPDGRRLLLAFGALAGALVMGAVWNRVRNGRFVRAANGLLVVALLVPVVWGGDIHWGTLTIFPAGAMLLCQVAAVALPLTLHLGTGVAGALTGGLLVAMILFLHGAAYLPMDALAQVHGGHVPTTTLLGLLPQTLCVTAFLLCVSAASLNRHDI